MVPYILLVFLLILLGGIVLRFYASFRKQAEIADIHKEEIDANPLVNSGEVDWQTITKHLRLQELISFEGITVAGDKYHAILSLSVGNQIHLIYFSLGSLVFRVRAGDISIASVKVGEGLRIRFEDNQVTMTGLKDIGNDVQVQNHVLNCGFQVVVLLTNSLVDGIKIHYAARAATLNCGFIKEWDIPTVKSDTSGVAEISSVADVAKLAEKVKDIQFISALTKSNKSAIKIKNGVCYVLGKVGGEKVLIDCDSDIAVMIVPEFGFGMLLTDFIKNLNVVNQMHARIVFSDQSINVAAQNPDSSYNFIPIKEQNVMLTMTDGLGKEIPVLKIESAGNFSNLITVSYIPSVLYKNTIMWSVS